MNSNSKFSKSIWADGKPSIDIDPYTHSHKGFNLILEKMARYFDFKPPRTDIIDIGGIPELQNFWAEIDILGEKVIIAMDEYTCSIACDSKSLRDQIIKVLQSIRKLE